MQLESLSEVRVLLVARKGSGAQILRTVFNLAGIGKLTNVDDTGRALELLSLQNFHAVYFEGVLEHDGVPFALAARRLPTLLNPMVAIFAVYPGARQREVEKARDLGVHDVICRPVSPKTIVEKLRGVLGSPRPFIAAPSFFGPDRRSKNRAGTPPVRERRARIAKKTRITLPTI